MNIFTYENNMHVSADFKEIEGQMRIVTAIVCCAITGEMHTYRYVGGDEIIDGELAELSPDIFEIIKSVNRKRANFHRYVLN